MPKCVGWRGEERLAEDPIVSMHVHKEKTKHSLVGKKSSRSIIVCGKEVQRALET